MSKANTISFVDSMSLNQNDSSSTNTFYDDTIKDLAQANLFTNVRLISTPLAAVGVTPDLVDEDFDPDPGWSETGSNANVLNNRVEVRLNVPVETNSFFVQTYTSQTEVWCSFEWTIGADTVLPSGAIFGGGLTEGGGVTIATLGLIQSSGLKFSAAYRTDSGTESVTVSSPLPVVGTKYTVTCHYKSATAVAANDGIVQIWIDTALVLDLSNVDSDTVTVPMARAGFSQVNSSALGLQIIDNVKVGTTGLPPSTPQTILNQYKIPDDVVVILEMFYDSSVLPQSTINSLNALNQEWRDIIGRPMAHVVEEETTKLFRLYPKPDLNSEDFIFLFGEPFGRDFPEYAVGIIHTEIRANNPDWLDYIIGLKVIAKEHQKNSDIVDPQFASLCDELADLLTGAFNA